MHLQRTIGNQVVQKLFQSGVIQAKLKIGQPNDIYEQEADRMADQVMRMPESPCSDCKDEEEKHIHTKLISDQITPVVQRQIEEEEEEEILQTKSRAGQSPEITPDLESSIQVLRGGGQPLPESSRTFFEHRFGYDFSNVRVHTDSRAAENAQAVKAQTFTTGKDIVFGGGQYSPETSKGKRLLAHELTHVVQQTYLRRVSRMQLKEGEKKRERIWKRDPFAIWGQRGNRGTSWGLDGPIPSKHRPNVMKALELVYGLGKNKAFLRKFHHVVVTITKGSAPQVQDMWKLISFFFKTLDRIVLYLADTSKDPKIQQFIRKPSPGGPEEGFSYPGRPDVWLRDYRLKQGSRKIANTIVHEAAHVAGVLGTLWFDVMIQAIEKASGFPRGQRILGPK